VQLEGDTDKDADKKTMPIVGDVYTTSGGLLEERETEKGERENFSILSHMTNDLSSSYCLMQQTEARKYRWLCAILWKRAKIHPPCETMNDREIWCKQHRILSFVPNRSVIS